MPPYIDVTFAGRPRDPSVEASAHRWIARLEAMHLSIRLAHLTVEPRGRHRTIATLHLMLADGRACATTASHEDPYVAIADAFRAARHELQHCARRGAAHV